MEVDLTKYKFYEIANVDDIPNGERIFLEIGTNQIVVFNITGNFYAIGDVCTHDDGPLGDGELDGYEVICPRHGARFDVRSGKATALPAVFPTPSYPIKVVDGKIEIGVPV
ncbi:MAG TPA: non-heme iron oxygenase ferredoxin subunit [Anaerolineaceae bacterium]|nr:non-heme iron oxygenase ferredoxin subunit [Anaerolineaceae bacterium]